MDLLRIEILNPKANRLLKDMADLKLISIKKEKATDFSIFLKKLRSKSGVNVSLAEITKEVNLVRAKRYGKKAS